MLGEAGNMRFDQVLSCLDLIEVLPCAHRLRRVTQVAGPTVPVLANSLDGRVRESRTLAERGAHRMTDILHGLQEHTGCDHPRTSSLPLRPRRRPRRRSTAAYVD